MEKKNFDFKPVDYGNLHELADMFKACFGVNPPQNYFEWKFLQNPAGRAVGYTAYHEGDVAGFYGVIPEQFMAGGAKVVIYQSMDTMTHPNYQRQGLFTNLARTTYQHLIERDKEVFIIGFPGITSHPGFVKKLGWKDIVLIDYMFLNRTAFKVRNLFSKSSNLSFSKVQMFEESFNSYFSDKSYQEKRISRFYNENFLNWRLSNNPSLRYEVAKVTEAGVVIGFFVYRLDEEKRCFVNHIDFINDELYEKYTNAICDYLFETTQSSFLYTFEPTLPSLNQAFKKNWFLKNTLAKGPFSYKPPFIGYSNKEKINGIGFFQKDSYDIEPLLRDY